MKRWVREKLEAAGRRSTKHSRSLALGHNLTPKLVSAEIDRDSSGTDLMTALQVYREFQGMQLRMSFEEWLLGAVSLSQRRAKHKKKEVLREFQ